MRTHVFVRSMICQIVFLVLLRTGGYGQSPTNQATANDAGFDAFLATLEGATNRFINGDPTLWKQLCSQSNEATILGGFGGYEKGWREVGPRYNWASAQFRASGAKKNFTCISKIVQGDLAYTVTIERADELWAGQEKATAQALRVTQIYRKENGTWKLLHRHADPFLDKKAPTLTPPGKP